MLPMTIFDAPGWKEETSVAYQGYWTRWVLERPTTRADGTTGWVGVLDSAALRHTHEAPWMDPWRVMVSLQWLSLRLGPTLVDTQVHENLWQEHGPKGRRLPTLGQPGDGQDPPTSRWVGGDWVAGWTTDRMLQQGSALVRDLDKRQDTLSSLLAVCTDRGHPHGMGWGMPSWQGGREHDRLPWRASAHQKMEMHDRLGNPQPWDPAEARLSWAVMGRIHSDIDAAERAAIQQAS